MSVSVVVKNIIVKYRRKAKTQRSADLVEAWPVRGDRTSIIEEPPTWWVNSRAAGLLLLFPKGQKNDPEHSEGPSRTAHFRSTRLLFCQVSPGERQFTSGPNVPNSSTGALCIFITLPGLLKSFLLHFLPVFFIYIIERKSRGADFLLSWPPLSNRWKIMWNSYFVFPFHQEKGHREETWPRAV